MSRIVKRFTDRISGGNSDSEKPKKKRGKDSKDSHAKHEASSSSQNGLWRKASKHHLGPFSDNSIAKVTKEINDHRPGEGHLIWYEEDGYYINVIISKTQPTGHDYQLADGGVSLGKQTFNANDPNNEKLWDALAAMVKPEDESANYTEGW